MRHIKDIYPMVNEVRQRIIETMRQRGIKTVTFCPDEETYEREHENDEDAMDYYDYRNDNCPCVVFFDKYNCGGDYFVMSLELEDGNYPLFKMQCDGEFRDGEFYDSDVMWLSMLNVYESLEMELGIDKDDEPEKVYVLTNHAATECEYLGTNNRVFRKKEDALKAFEEWKKDELPYVKRYEWRICEDSAEHFEACEEGDYCANHTEGFVNEYEIQ